MKIPKRIRLPADAYAQPETIFHLVIHAHPRFARWPEAARRAIWDTVLEQRNGDRVELFAACLMPDHLHLVLRRQRLDILQFLNRWKTWATRQVWTTGVRGQVFQPGMWDRTIRGRDDFEQTVDYVVRNPVAAGLVEHERDWPWAWAWYWDDVES